MILLNPDMSDLNMPADDQLKWLCDLSMKRLEAAHRDYDTINTRTGVVIGFAGLFNSLLLPTWMKLPPQIRFYSGLAWLLFALIMLFCAFWAYQVTQVEGIPLKRRTVESYLEKSESDSRLQFVSDVLIAADRMATVNRRKALRLSLAITTLALQIFLSLSVIILGRMFSHD